jgi:hypothetical protein
LAALLVSQAAHAADAMHASSGAFTIDHDNPRATVPPEAERSAQPAAFTAWLGEVRTLATKAEQEGEWAQAVKYHQALSFAEPSSAAAFRKLCEIHEAGLGERQQAEHYCWAAIKRQDATLTDRYHFLDLAFALQASDERGGVKVKRAQMIQAVLEDLRAEAVKDPAAVPSRRAGAPAHLPLAQQREIYACQLAASVAVQAALEECLQSAAAIGVPKRSLLPFEWALLHAKGDVTGSAAVERAAKEAGLVASDLARVAVGGVPLGPVLSASVASNVAPTPAVADAESGQVTDPSSPNPSATIAKGGRWEEVFAIGAGAIGVAALVWLAMDRGRRSKSGLAEQPK